MLKKEVFRKSRECVDQIFAVKILVENYLEKDRKLFAAFRNLEAPMIGSTGRTYRMLREYMGWEGNGFRGSGPSMRMQVPVLVNRVE